MRLVGEFHGHKAAVHAICFDMNIAGVTGISEAQRVSLVALGAVDAA